MVKSTRGPDHIADHVESRGCRHHYVLYSTGADYYDLPYWTFVHLAKDAGSTVDLHRIQDKPGLYGLYSVRESGKSVLFMYISHLLAKPERQRC